MLIRNKDIKKILLDYYSIKPVSLYKVKQGIVNFNYIIRTGDTDYLFKIYKRRTSKEVAFELGILDYLAAKDFPSPRVIRNNKKRLYFKIENRPCVLLDYIPGEILSRITSRNLFKVGVLFGRLHCLLRNYKQIADKDTRFSPEPRDLKRYINTEKESIVKRKFPDAENFVNFISQEFQNLYLPNDLPVGITHQDIKPENIILDKKGSMSFIDFDNSYRGILLYDFMTTVIWTCFRDGRLQRNLFEAFTEGYATQRPFAQKEKKCFRDALLFRLLRESFVWPMQSISKSSIKNSRNFLQAYKSIKKDKKLIMSLWKS